MKQILKLVFLLVIGQTAFAQAPSNYTNINGRYRWIAGMFDSTFHIPKGTTPSLRTGGSTNAGGLFYNTADSSVYTYTGTQWIKVRGSLNPSDTSNKYVTQVYKKSGSDSVFYVKGGVHTWAFNDSTGSAGGGGGGKVYYFNGGVSMGTFGGLSMYELGDTANTGAAANFTRATTGAIANFITDPNKPGLLQIPAGVWTIDAWLSETGSGANHAQIWAVLEKWNGSAITTIATSPIEEITEGSTPNLYTWAITVPTTALTVTDRIIIQFYITNTNGKTVTLYTQNGYVGEVHTTFTTGIGAINGLTAPAQYLVTGTSGTDFNISSATATHTFNLPTASATNRGALSSADWTTFNNKGSVSSVATNNGTGITGGTITTSGTLAIDTLLISTRAWRQKGIDSLSALITGNVSGTTNYIPKFTSSSAIGNSIMYEGTNAIGIATTSPGRLLTIKNSSDGVNGISFQNYTSTAELGYIRYEQTNDFLDIVNTSAFAGGGIKFSTNSTERMRITSGGNVGIGTTSPDFLLDVVRTTTGTVATFGIEGQTINPRLRIDADESNNTITLNPNYSGATSPSLVFKTQETERMRITSGGNVGIGTSSPAAKLQVSGGSIRLDDGQALEFGGSTNFILGDNTNNLFRFYTNNSEKMRLTSAGELLINTTSDAGDYKLQVNGNVYATAYFESSDLRLKNVLSKNKGNDGINTITFKWKDGRDNLTHIGYVAQEVEKVLPDAVKTNPDGYKTVNYDEVQTLKIANLEQEVKELKALIKKLMDKK